MGGRGAEGCRCYIVGLVASIRRERRRIGIIVVLRLSVVRRSLHVVVVACHRRDRDVCSEAALGVGVGVGSVDAGGGRGRAWAKAQSPQEGDHALVPRGPASSWCVASKRVVGSVVGGCPEQRVEKTAWGFIRSRSPPQVRALTGYRTGVDTLQVALSGMHMYIVYVVVHT